MATAARAPLNRPILATARTETRQVQRTQRRRPLLATARGTACGFRCTRRSGRLSRRMFPDARRCGPGFTPRSSRITHFGGARAENWVSRLWPAMAGTPVARQWHGHQGHTYFLSGRPTAGRCGLPGWPTRSSKGPRRRSPVSQAATERNQVGGPIDQGCTAEPHSAVPLLDGWLTPFITRQRVLYRMSPADCAPNRAPTASAQPTQLTSSDTPRTPPTAIICRKCAPICAPTTGEPGMQDTRHTTSKLGKRSRRDLRALTSTC